MSQEKDLDGTLDWEYMSDFYQEEGKEIPSFEEYAKVIAEGEPESTVDMEQLDELEGDLAKTVKDVTQVKNLSVEGKTIKEIAEMLLLEESYVELILMTVEGYPEDNEIAVAHLVMLG